MSAVLVFLRTNLTMMGRSDIVRDLGRRWLTLMSFLEMSTPSAGERFRDDCTAPACRHQTPVTGPQSADHKEGRSKGAGSEEGGCRGKGGGREEGGRRGGSGRIKVGVRGLEVRKLEGG